MPKPKTIAEVARVIGVSERTLYGYFGGGCPSKKLRNGCYDIEAIEKWRAENKPAPATKVPVSELAEALKRAELDKLTEDARAKRLKNDLLEKNVVYRDEILQEWNENVLRVKTRLEAIPDECEMLLPGEVRRLIKQEIADKIHLVLKEMAAWKSVAHA